VRDVANPPVSDVSQDRYQFLVFWVIPEILECFVVREHRDFDEMQVLPEVEVVADSPEENPGILSAALFSETLIAVIDVPARFLRSVFVEGNQYHMQESLRDFQGLTSSLNLMPRSL